MQISKNTKIKNYQIIRVIGEGRYSTVYQANKIGSDSFVAIKAINTEKEMYTSCYVENEKMIIKHLKPHELIIKYYEYFKLERYFYFLNEFVDGYSLLREINHFYSHRNKSNLSFEIIKDLFLQTIEGVEFLHSINIYHCDLKPENVLLNGEKIKIIDFGCAVYSEEKELILEKGFINSSPGYGPPETFCIKSELVSLEKVDVWGLGCLLYYLFTGKILFNGGTSTEVFLNVKNYNFNYSGLKKPIKDICNLIFIDTNLRLTLAELKELIREVDVVDLGCY